MSLSQSKWEVLSHKGRTIRKPMGGGGGRACEVQKNIRARER